MGNSNDRYQGGTMKDATRFVDIVSQMTKVGEEGYEGADAIETLNDLIDLARNITTEWDRV